MNLSKIDWDDLRFFLAVARTGTVTGAARQLGVNHSTVTRRISAFEKKVGVRLFERLSSGYMTTPTGDEVFGHAERMEAEFNAMDREIIGRDNKLSGTLRVTAPATLINQLFMPHIARFIETYPDIELDLLASYTSMNLNRREADIAIRVTNTPAENLIGRRLGHITRAVYASHEYLRCHPELEEDIENYQPVLLLWSIDGKRPQTPQSDWLRQRFPNAHVACQTNSLLVLMEAAKAGIGIAQLACFAGDRDPTLRRVAGFEVQHDWDIWMLTHTDLRTTARVRVFLDFMQDAISRQRDLIEGRCPFVG